MTKKYDFINMICEPKKIKQCKRRNIFRVKDVNNNLIVFIFRKDNVQVKTRFNDVIYNKENQIIYYYEKE